MNEIKKESKRFNREKQMEKRKKERKYRREINTGNKERMKEKKEG